MFVQLKLIYELFWITKRTAITTPRNCQNARNANNGSRVHKSGTVIVLKLSRKEFFGN
jgi:hypothetical protein